MSSRSRKSSAAPPKDQTRLKIERMEAEREQRRKMMKERKQKRAQQERKNIAAGNPGDVDFIQMVQDWRETHENEAQPHDDGGDGMIASFSDQDKICICVRKRPHSDKERSKKDHDSVTVLHPTVWVHSAKLRVDGISKYLDHNSYQFDHAFDERMSTEEVYRFSTMPLVEFVCTRGGRATVFAYGQTGSGKTYTMQGIQSMVADDIFLLLTDEESDVNVDNTTVTVTFLELYGGLIQDLLNDRKRLKLLEDGRGEVVIAGLKEFEAHSPEDFLELVETGNRNRTTHMTEANDTSSRSHAMCQIILRDKVTGKMKGKMSLVDLAGSERGTDTKSHDRKRRTESSEINTSLLALKECIRALGNEGRSNKGHVPYRASKLTLILKDCFTGKLTKTTMIATVSPGASSADHTLNTLRYADRIKEKKVGSKLKNHKQQPREKKQIREASDERSVTSENIVSIADFSSEDDLLADDAYDHDDIEEHREEERAEEEEGEQTEEEEEEHCIIDEHDRLLETLLDVEEEILNLHMSIIQENAEFLTEEGQLLQTVTSDDVTDKDVDKYAARLEAILERKTELVVQFQEMLTSYQDQLKMQDQLKQSSF